MRKFINEVKFWAFLVFWASLIIGFFVFLFWLDHVRFCY